MKLCPAGRQKQAQVKAREILSSRADPGSSLGHFHPLLQFASLAFILMKINTVDALLLLQPVTKRYQTDLCVGITELPEAEVRPVQKFLHLRGCSSDTLNQTNWDTNKNKAAFSRANKLRYLSIV